MKPINLSQTETPVIVKTRELCQTILDQPAYQTMKKTLQDFLAESTLRAHYQRLCDQQDALHHKHEHGEAITDEELAAFEKDESAFLNNPLAQGFIEAQRQMQKIEHTVTSYVRRTFELGRLPTADEVSDEGCGPGCGCH